MLRLFTVSLYTNNDYSFTNKWPSGLKKVDYLDMAKTCLISLGTIVVINVILCMMVLAELWLFIPLFKGAINTSKNFRTDPGCAWDSAFTLGHCVTEASHAWLDFRVGLRVAQHHLHHLLYIICCLQHRALVWNYSRQMMRLQQ